MYEEDYSVMLVRGETTDELNKEKWDILHDKFMQRGGGINYAHSMLLIKQISKISGKITVVESTLELMRLTYSTILNDIINSYGFNREFPLDADKYVADLNAVESMLGADKLRLTLKQDELAEFTKKSQEGTAMTQDSYIDMVWDISLAFKLQINLNAITVNDLLILMAKFKKHVDQINRNNRR